MEESLAPDKVRDDTTKNAPVFVLQAPTPRTALTSHTPIGIDV